MQISEADDTGGIFSIFEDELIHISLHIACFYTLKGDSSQLRLPLYFLLTFPKLKPVYGEKLKIQGRSSAISLTEFEIFQKTL